VAEQLPFESRRSPVMAVAAWWRPPQPLAARSRAQVLARGAVPRMRLSHGRRAERH
jgi:hypothetical protein